MKASGAFPTDIARYYFHQLLSTVEYIHQQGFVHRDIKPANILLDDDCNIKLADFGASIPYNKENEEKLL